MTEKERLVKATEYALQLRNALQDVHVYTDNIPLEEIASEMIQQTETIRRKLSRFADGE